MPFDVSLSLSLSYIYIYIFVCIFRQICVYIYIYIVYLMALVTLTSRVYEWRKWSPHALCIYIYIYRMFLMCKTIYIYIYVCAYIYRMEEVIPYIISLSLPQFIGTGREGHQLHSTYIYAFKYVYLYLYIYIYIYRCKQNGNSPPLPFCMYPWISIRSEWDSCSPQSIGVYIRNEMATS